MSKFEIQRENLIFLLQVRISFTFTFHAYMLDEKHLDHFFTYLVSRIVPNRFQHFSQIGAWDITFPLNIKHAERIIIFSYLILRKSFHAFRHRCL